MTNYNQFSEFLDYVESGDYHSAADSLSAGMDLRKDEIRWKDVREINYYLRERGLEIKQSVGGWYTVEEIT